MRCFDLAAGAEPLPAGEVSPQDRALVPQPEPGPSVEFIEQLKAFTIAFRLPVTGAYKSF